MAPDGPGDTQGNGAQQPSQVPRHADPDAAGRSDIGGDGPGQGHVKRDRTDKSGTEGRPTGQRGTGQRRTGSRGTAGGLSLIHISEPTRRTPISYAVFCL